MHYAAATTTIAFQQLTPSYTVSAKPASLTVKQGSSGSATFTVTPQNGFNQAVSFLCDNATLPKGVTCSFSPASVTPNGTAAVTSTLTVQTTGATVVSLDRRMTDGSGWLRGGVALTLLLFGIPGARRRSWPGVRDAYRSLDRRRNDRVWRWRLRQHGWGHPDGERNPAGRLFDPGHYIR